MEDALRQGWELAYTAVGILVGSGSLLERLTQAAEELRLIDPATQVPSPLRAQFRHLLAELENVSTVDEAEAEELAHLIFVFHNMTAELYQDLRRLWPSGPAVPQDSSLFEGF